MCTVDIHNTRHAVDCIGEVYLAVRNADQGASGRVRSYALRRGLPIGSAGDAARLLRLRSDPVAKEFNKERRTLFEAKYKSN